VPQAQQPARDNHNKLNNYNGFEFYANFEDEGAHFELLVNATCFS